MLLKQFEYISNSIHPDFIVVTGDFRDKKRKTDFKPALDYLNSIISFFKITNKDVFLVPGNHDAEDTTREQKRVINNISKQTENDYNYYNSNLSALYRRFSAYDSFCKDFYNGISDDRFSDPCKTKLCTWNDKINIVCLNTSLISDGDKSHKEILDLDALYEILENCKNKLPFIVLGHHDLDYFYESHYSRFMNICKDQVSAYLHGDIHKSGHDSRPSGGKYSLIPSISCGKSCPESGDEYSDVGAVFYELKSDNKVYIKWYKWYENGGIRKLDEDRSFGPALGKDTFFEMIKNK